MCYWVACTQQLLDYINTSPSTAIAVPVATVHRKTGYTFFDANTLIGSSGRAHYWETFEIFAQTATYLVKWHSLDTQKHCLSWEPNCSTIRKAAPCVSELSLYYSYYTKKLLPPNFPSHIFYSTIQEHLHQESTLHDLDNWLSTYRDLILDSKQHHSLVLVPTLGAPLVVSNQRGLNRSFGVGILLE